MCSTGQAAGPPGQCFVERKSMASVCFGHPVLPVRFAFAFFLLAFRTIILFLFPHPRTVDYEEAIQPIFQLCPISCFRSTFDVPPVPLVPLPDGRC